MLKRFSLSVIASLFIASGAYAACPDILYQGKYPKTTIDTVTLCKTMHIVGFSKQLKIPVWVAEELTSANHVGGVKRSGSFKRDPELAIDVQANDSVYRGSDYDKGHMAPFEDLNATEKTAAESFLYSNAVPQNYHFNRGKWRSLEDKVRDLALKEDIYVITGVVPGKTSLNGVNIPDQMFKVIIRKNTKTYTIVIMNNEANPTRRFASLGELKRLSGLSLQSVTGLTRSDSL